MKRIQSLAVILLAALLLSSCAKKNADENQKPDSDAVGVVTDKETGNDGTKDENNDPSPDGKTTEKDESSTGKDGQMSTDPIRDDGNTAVSQPSVDTPVVDPLNGAGVTSTVPKNDYSTVTLESFFQNAAFVGDSVMYGFDLYTGRNQTLEDSSTFLTITSFAARHALSDVGPKSYHPSYNGEKMKVEDALALDQDQAVFVFLGLNDVRVTPNSYYENYIEFMGRIREKNPNIDIFILSTTYPVESPGSMDRQTAASYRDQLQDLNVRLKAWCDEGNGYFINVVSPLLSDNGFLKNEYSSDNYVHLTNSAYAIWATTIENYISELIETGSAPQTAFVEFTNTPASENTPETPAPENTPETPATEENVPPSENHESAPAEAPSEVPDVPAPEIAENPESIENTTPEEV